MVTRGSLPRSLRRVLRRGSSTVVAPPPAEPGVSTADRAIVERALPHTMAGEARRIFLTRRSAAFDAAAAALVVAGATRRRSPLLAALPYARFLVGDARAPGRRAPAGVLTRVAAGGLGAGALMYGSLTSRSMLL